MLACDAVLERFAVHELHGDEVLAVLLTDVVDGANVGMIERGSSLGLAAEAFQRGRGLRGFPRKKFESDKAAKPRVFGLVNDAHTATTELFEDAVVGDDLPQE